MRAQKPPSAVVLARAYCVLLWPGHPTLPRNLLQRHRVRADDVSTSPYYPYPPGRPTAHVLLTNQQYNSKVTLTRPAPHSTHAKPIARIHSAVGTAGLSNRPPCSGAALTIFSCLSSDPLLPSVLSPCHRSPRKRVLRAQPRSLLATPAETPPLPPVTSCSSYALVVLQIIPQTQRHKKFCT